MADLTYKRIDEMETVYGDVLGRARAELGVTAFGMQVVSLAAGWDGYPEHDHGEGALDPGQEEVYVPIAGGGVLQADGETYDLVPGVAVRVGPGQTRRIVPDDEGLTMLALGGLPGTFAPSPWTELSGPRPMAPAR